MRTRQERRRISRRGGEPPDDIADGIDMRREPGGQHPVPNLFRGLPMRRREVGARQRLLLFAELRELVGHRHDLRSDRLVDQIRQPEPRDPRDLIQRDGLLDGDVVIHALLERRDDRRSVVLLHGQHERKPESLLVPGIQSPNTHEILLRAIGQARALLLARRGGRQLATRRRSARQLRMRSNERQLLFD